MSSCFWRNHQSYQLNIKDLYFESKTFSNILVHLTGLFAILVLITSSLRCSCQMRIAWMPSVICNLKGWQPKLHRIQMCINTLPGARHIVMQSRGQFLTVRIPGVDVNPHVGRTDKLFLLMYLETWTNQTSRE